MPEVQRHGNESTYAIVLVLFILLAIIGCVCYAGYGTGYGCGYC